MRAVRETSTLADDHLARALDVGADGLFALLAERLSQSPGFRLLTLLAPNQDGLRLDRLQSSDPRQYPPGPADLVEDTPWFRQLFRERRLIVANSPAEIRAILPDFSEFEDQGHGSLLNLPVVCGGVTIGLMNLMDTPGHFHPLNVAAVARQAGLAALTILAAGITNPVLPSEKA